MKSWGFRLMEGEVSSMFGWLRRSYKNKVYGAFILIWMVPFLFMLIFDYYYVYDSTVQNIEQYVNSNLEIAAKLIDSDLSTFSGIVNSVALNDEVAEIIEKDTLTSQKDFHETQRLYNTVQTSMAGLPNRVPVHIVNRDQQSRYSTTNYFTPYYIDERGNLYETMEKEADLGIVSSQIHWRIDGTDSQDICYALGRAIRSEDKDETIGYVILDIFDSYFQDIFHTIASQQGANLIVADNRGTVITDMEKKYYTGYKLDGGINAALTQTEGQFEVNLDKQRYKVYFQSGEMSHLRVIELIPREYFITVTLDNMKPHILMFSLVFLLGTILIFKNVKSIVTPVLQLDQAMNQVKKGDFSARVSISGEDEIAGLGQTFNVMTGRIQQLITDNYEKNLALNKAEMKALKAQVNPHFLYNCLNSIHMMASLGKDEEVMKMTKALGRYYRYRVKNETELVPLSEELLQIENYLEIQKIRYKDKLTVRIRSEEGTGDEMIPKLLLQPIVENAIIHGIEQKLEPGQVVIDVFYFEEGMKIQIKDDGADWGESREHGEGTGLENTRQRLNYQYGDGYELNLYRDEPFTVVEIYLRKGVRDV